MFSLEISDRDIARLSAAAARVPLATDAGLKRVGDKAHEIAERKVGQIYSRPIPRRASGKAMWTRSGDLLAKVKAPLKITRGKVALTANTPYASARHDLGVSRTPRKPALGVIRKNPFFAETLEAVEPLAATLFAEGMEEELKR